MIILRSALPTPKEFWKKVSAIVRLHKKHSLFETIYHVDFYCRYIGIKYNVDNDLLYTDYGKKAIEIYR